MRNPKKKIRLDSGQQSEGVLIFDHELRPIYCNKRIMTLCGRVCEKDRCVLQESGQRIPELFAIIKRFREDYLGLLRKSGGEENYRPRSIVYLSKEGDFTIRCLSLEPDLSSRKGQLWQVILQEAVGVHQNDIEVIDQKYGFTKREKEIFKLLIKRLTALEVSKKLGISKETAKVHIHNIFRKMGIAHRSEILSSLQ